MKCFFSSLAVGFVVSLALLASSFLVVFTIGGLMTYYGDEYAAGALVLLIGLAFSAVFYRECKGI